MTRDEATKHFELMLGAKIQSSVTKETDMLLVGSDPGFNKREKAMRVGVPIIPWTMFVATGALEPRGFFRYNDLPFDHDLYSTVVLNLIEGVDRVAAHYAVGTDTRFFRALGYGFRAIEYVLQGAWGPCEHGYPTGLEDDPINSGLSSEKCFRQACGEWAIMIAVFEGDEERVEKFLNV